MSPLISLDFHGVVRPVKGSWANVIRWHVAHSVSEVTDVLEAVWVECQNGYEAVGWVSYEAAPAFDPAFFCTAPLTFEGTLQSQPLAVFGIVAPASLSFSPMAEVPRERLSSVAQSYPLQWETPVTRAFFNQQLEVVHAAILAGETYQVNLTQRLQASFAGDIWQWYLALCEAQQAGFNAFIHYQDWAVLSCSPELFFEWDRESGKVTTRPMKGTVGRAAEAAEDQARGAWLQASEKNRAENVMIVDLMRNDLSRIASQVTVPHLFNLERYSTVWQMTSTVQGTVATDVRWVEVFKALFPCGSVVGAPKLKTAEHIARLEGSARGVYCGAVGWVSADRAVFNVPIRTVQWNAKAQRAIYGVGNGLTIDSKTEEEWREIKAKCQFLMDAAPPADWSLFETLLWTPEDGFGHGTEHIERITSSAMYWGWIGSPVEQLTIKIKLLAALQSASTEGGWNEPQRVKVMLMRDLTFTVDAEAWSWKVPDRPLEVALAMYPISENVDHRWLTHKTTYRAVYDVARATKPRWAWDVLLWNAKGELTEFSQGNVAVELGGVWYTPPISSGLLPGVARDLALRSGHLHERTITKAMIKDATGVAFLNSLRGWVPVVLREEGK